MWPSVLVTYIANMLGRIFLHFHFSLSHGDLNSASLERWFKLLNNSSIWWKLSWGWLWKINIKRLLVDYQCYFWAVLDAFNYIKIRGSLLSGFRHKFLSLWYFFWSSMLAAAQWRDNGATAYYGGDEQDVWREEAWNRMECSVALQG